MAWGSRLVSRQFVLTCPRQEFRGNGQSGTRRLMPDLGVCTQLTREPSKGR